MENNNETEIKVSGKRARKIAQREAKAERKARNAVEEKKKRPSNLLLAVLIFGVLIAMFLFIWGYNYFSKEASIETYLANNGGKDTFSSISIDENTSASVSAKKNDMKVVIKIDSDDEEYIKEKTEYYNSKEGKADLKYVGAYYLYMCKPQTRARHATAACVVKINGESVRKVKLDYEGAEKLLKKYGLLADEQ